MIAWRKFTNERFVIPKKCSYSTRIVIFNMPSSRTEFCRKTDGFDCGDDAVTVSSDVDGEQVLFVTRLNANGDSSTVYRYSGMGEIVAASNGWGEDVAPFITVWMTATGYRVAVFVKRNGAVERAIEDGSEVPPEIRNIWRNGIRIGSSIQVTEISWVKGEDGSRHKRPSKTRTYEWIDSKFHLSETPWP